MIDKAYEAHGAIGVKVKLGMPEPDGQCPECQANDWVLKRSKYGDDKILMAEFECVNCGCTVVLNFGDDGPYSDDEFAPEFEDLTELESEPPVPAEGGRNGKRGIPAKKGRNQKPPRTVTFAIESLMRLAASPSK